MFDDFIKDYQKAERPIMLVGGGVWWAKASSEVRELGRVLGIPCIPTWNAIDIITNDYELYRGRAGTFGGAGRNFAIQTSDLILAIGCRFSCRITGGVPGNFAPRAKKYVVDIDKTQLENPTVKAYASYRMDAKLFSVALLNVLRKRKIKTGDFTQWLNKTGLWMVRYQPCLLKYFKQEEKVNPYVFIKTLSGLCNPRDIIVADCGGNVVVTYQTFETKWGQRVISSHGNSPMGFSFAGAIGAQLAEPNRRVICLVGDGGFNMNIQELQTVVNYNLPIKTFIMNNHIYGITHQFQDTHFGGRYEASGPKGYNPPDFIPIVKAYGIETDKIDNHKNLSEMVTRVLNYPTAIVCDVDLGDWHDYTPRVMGWATPIQDMYPYLPREEYNENMGRKSTGWGEEKWNIASTDV